MALGSGFLVIWGVIFFIFGVDNDGTEKPMEVMLYENDTKDFKTFHGQFDSDYSINTFGWTWSVLLILVIVIPILIEKMKAEKPVRDLSHYQRKFKSGTKK